MLRYGAEVWDGELPRLWSFCSECGWESFSYKTASRNVFWRVLRPTWIVLFILHFWGPNHIIKTQYMKEVPK